MDKLNTFRRPEKFIFRWRTRYTHAGEFPHFLGHVNQRAYQLGLERHSAQPTGDGYAALHE